MNEEKKQDIPIEENKINEEEKELNVIIPEGMPPIPELEEDDKEESLEEDKDEIDVLREKFKKAKAESRDYKDKWMRSVAEFDNYRKRTQKEKKQWIQNANAKLIREIISVLDNFDRTLDNVKSSDNIVVFKDGLELVYQHLMDILYKEGLEAFESIGKEFNPEVHDAMMMIESDEYPEGIIAQEFEKGYRLNNTLLRPARVIVSKGPATPTTKDNEIENKETKDEELSPNNPIKPTEE